MKTFRLFSMAALALAMAACSSEDNEILQNTQQPGTMHFTATIAAPSGDATTRTVYTEVGTTINVNWKVGDQIALVHNGVVDVAEVKTVDNVTGKATIEATITGSPSDDDGVYLAYPADAVADATPYYPLPFTPNPVIFDKVKNSQDGTLAYIQDNLDLRMGSGKLAVSGSDVSLKESVSVSSLICIWKLTLQDNAATPNALNATKLTFKNNTFTQAEATSTGKSEYYLCVVPSFIPDPSGTFSFEATVGGDTYTFSKTGLSLTAGKYYQSTLTMAKAAPAATNLSTINANYTANDGETLTGTLGKTVKISIADGATVTLAGVDINTNTTLSSGNYAGITCLGDATIILKDGTTNSVRALNNAYPGIYVPQGNTLTIQGETLGTGILNATGRGSTAGAGIGAASESTDIYRSCGNIVIAGGVINARAGSERAAGIGCGGSSNPGSSNPSTCGTITITGGTITATGGKWAPGIGGGYDGDCGDITIANTVTSVTATKGDKGSYLATSFDCIGRGRDGACGTVKFGNQTMYDGSIWTTTPTSGSTYDGLSLTISQTVYEADTWTLTPVLP